MSERSDFLGPDWVTDCKRWIGITLTGKYAHWCFEWDGLPVDETSNEFASCSCTWGGPEGETEFEELKKKAGEAWDNAAGQR